MRSQLKVALSVLIVPALTGCLDSFDGTEVINKDLNNSDFTVEAPPTDSSNSGQSGSDPVTSPTTPINDIPGAPQIVRGLIINNDAKITGSKDLNILFDPPFTSAYVKLTANESCVGGQWQDFADETQVTAAAGGTQYYSAQFRDHDGRISRCYFRSIVIDDKGPSILFSKYPASAVEEGNEVEIVYSVTDELSAVKSVTCEFAGLQKPCASGVATVKFPSMAMGDYVFKVSAEDTFGHKSEKSIGFRVTSTYRRMAQEVKVNEYNKVDILFVIDNSGSMEYEQKNMASRVRNFLDVVKGLDWQIGVITTDPTSNIPLGDGKLLPMKGLNGVYVLNSSMDFNLAKDTLSATLQRTETGSGHEQGILATYRMLERAQDSKSVNSRLVRDGAQLAVVLISDEDESANTFRNDPSNLINYIQQTYKGQKAFSFHSIIARPGDKVCLAGEGYSAGFRYETISRLTGGVIGDVCAQDYAAQVQGIAEGVRKTLKTITLSCEPIIDQLRTLVVIKDGQPYSATYSVSGVNLVFDEMLPQGDYQFQYSCVR